MDNENYFGKLADEVCKTNVKDETWMNVYGRDYYDLLIIDLDKKLVELNSQMGALIEPYLSEAELGDEAVAVLQGVNELRSVLSDGEYPRVDFAVAIMTILKRGMDEVIDPLLITESYRLACQLLRYMPPSIEVLKQYWGTVFLKLTCDGEIEDITFTKLRGCFISVLRKICAEKDHENQRNASSAFLRVLCEMLEIDFAFFLTKHPRDASSAMLSSRNAPWISSLFWPNGMIHISGLQADFLKPVVEIMLSDEKRDNIDTYEVYCRLLAMIFEMTRLTEKGETVDAVSCQKTPQTLRRLLTDISCLSRQDVLEQLYDSLAFGWLKRAVRERLSEIGSRR